MRFTVMGQARRRLWALCVAAVIAVAALALPASVRAADGDVTVTIFHTNDVHGNVGGSSSVVGMDKVAAYKAFTPNALLVDAGDATQGNAFATLTKGQDVIKMMNAAGYDVMAAGNHEFDYGLDQLLANQRLANFPILSANAAKNGASVFKAAPYAGGAKTNTDGATFITTVAGVKVGFFGVTTPETAVKANPAGIVGVTFGNDNVIEIAAMAQHQIDALKAQGCELIVGLMHLGVDASSVVTSRAVAAKLTGLHLLVDGHSHTKVSESVNGITIVQTGSGGNNLGRVAVTLNAAKQVTAVTATLIGAADATITPYPAVTGLYGTIVEEQKALLAPVVGKTAATLWGGTITSDVMGGANPTAGINEGRLYETALGDLVADAMQGAAKAYVATRDAYRDLPVVTIMNGGGIRTTIHAGDITRGDIVNVLPFGNSLAYKIVTPDILYAAVENGVSGLKSQDILTGRVEGTNGGFPQVAGMRYEFNPNAAVGAKVTKIVLLNADGTDRQALERGNTLTRIVLAANDFEIAGGDNYTMLVGLESVGEGGVLDEIVVDYIRALTTAGGGSFTYPIKGRIKFVGGYAPKEYIAYITGEPGALVAYKVDGGAAQTGTIGQDGRMTFTVSDGPHTVTVAGRPDIFINNYSGAGFYAATTPVTPKAYLPMQPTDPAGTKVSAPVSANLLLLNGRSTSFPAAFIKDYNWLKLRDIALTLNGTTKQFAIGYDQSLNAITITPGQAYVPAGGELAALAGPTVLATSSLQKLIFDGKEISAAAYSIDNYNYFRLRDIAILLDFYVGYDAAAGAISPDFAKPYSE